MWKDISDWEDYYQINEYGEVRNKKTMRLIIGDINSSGYYRVCLYNGDIKKRYFRHRLVAIHFIDNPENFKEVNHIDGNKANNNYLNLEWASRSYNERHAWDNNLKSYNSGIFKNKPIKVEYNNGDIVVYKSQNELAKELGTYQGLVSSWLVHSIKSYKKFNIGKIEFV